MWAQIYLRTPEEEIRDLKSALVVAEKLLREVDYEFWVIASMTTDGAVKKFVERSNGASVAIKKVIKRI